MKVFATYQNPTGDLLELSAGETETGTQRVLLNAKLPLKYVSAEMAPHTLQGSKVYLSKAQALDLADAMRRAALELP